MKFLLNCICSVLLLVLIGCGGGGGGESNQNITPAANAPLAGTWGNGTSNLTMMTDGRYEVDINKDGVADSWGAYSNTPTQIVLQDTGGDNACFNAATQQFDTGTYSYTIVGNAMTLVLASDSCSGRSANLAGSGWLVQTIVDTTIDVTGNWSVTEKIGSNTCGEPTGESNSYPIDITATGNSLSVSTSVGTFSGSINGSAVSWAGSYPEDGGTTTITALNVTVSADKKSFSGTSSWRWTDGSFSCAGSSTVNGVQSNTQPSTAPTITDLSPRTGGVGLAVTISGTNFSTTPVGNTVKFNGTQAIVTAATATSLSVTVPSSATTGKVSVTTASGTATSVDIFTITTVGVTGVAGTWNYTGMTEFTNSKCTSLNGPASGSMTFTEVNDFVSTAAGGIVGTRNGNTLSMALRSPQQGLFGTLSETWAWDGANQITGILHNYCYSSSSLVLSEVVNVPFVAIRN